MRKGMFLPIALLTLILATSNLNATLIYTGDGTLYDNTIDGPPNSLSISAELIVSDLFYDYEGNIVTISDGSEELPWQFYKPFYMSVSTTNDDIGTISGYGRFYWETPSNYPPHVLDAVVWGDYWSVMDMTQLYNSGDMPWAFGPRISMWFHAGPMIEYPGLGLIPSSEIFLGLSAQPVPEPSTFLFLVSGLIGLVGIRKRIKK